MNTFNWTCEGTGILTINTLERAFDSGNLDPLLINDGYISGFEKAETPGAATPRESR